ncbi:hypothetical protein ACQKGI_18440 [Peribacillus muralis]
MKVCEVCGAEEELDQDGSGQEQMRILHLCETCRSERSFASQSFIQPI